MKRLINRIKKGVRLIYNTLLALRPDVLYINASVNVDYNGGIIKSNWGDDINYFFLNEIVSGKKILYSQLLWPIKFRSNYLVIGSIIEMMTNKSSVIWGAGIISSDTENIIAPKKVCAVRGPLTRQKLIAMGIDCPNIYGDPALLLPYHYSPKVVKTHKLGVIPHYVDKPQASSCFKGCKGIKFIDVNGYRDWHDFIDEILSCEVIVSSSLHGLIVAEAYNIPGIWAEFTSIKRDYFKYYDFYASIGKSNMAPIEINNKTELDDVVNISKKWVPGQIDLKPLIEACPLKLKLM